MENFQEQIDAGLKTLKAKIEEANKQSEAKFNDKVDKATYNEIETLVKSLQETVKGNTEYSEKLEAELEKFKKEGSVASTQKGFAKELGDFLKEKAEQGGSLSKIIKDKGSFSGHLESNLKAVGTMTTAASLTGEVIASDYVPGIVEIARRQLRVRQLLRQGTTSSNNIRFIREVAGEGSVGMQTEGSAKSQIDRDFTAVDAPVETMAGFVKISTQLLDDMTALRSFLPFFLDNELSDLEDNQLLYGDGTSPNLGGISDAGNFTTFAALSGDANAQIFDLMTQAITQLEIANESPNGIVLNPAQWLELYNLKDADNAYLRGLTFDQTLNTMSILGVPVFKTSAVTAGQYFVGDWVNGAQIFDRMGTDIRFFEQDGTNVQSNLVTVRAEKRLAFPVYRPTGFIYGTVATDIAKIVAFT